MTDRIEQFGLQVARPLFQMIETEALPGTGVSSQQFWKGLSDLIHTLGPVNRELLARRDSLQAQIDAWHVARRGQPHDADAYRAFLEQIGYLVPEGPDFSAETENVDPEIAAIPGPQLVVPVMNARYALNAA
ncbi:MAG TPA: malate synthase G, partial [Quisquiliibacterium sp.]|nr:malate synthase G [Quisquiliibacterium sp.]